MSDPTVLVEDLGQLCAAAAAATAAQMRVRVRSAPWFAGAYGVPVFAAMLEAVREAYPAAEMAAVLDCGPSAGLALIAFRHDLDIRIACSAEVRVKLTEIAAQMGRSIQPDDGPVLDLSACRRPEADCRAWLVGLAAQD